MIARAAVAAGVPLLLAGREESRVREQAHELGCDYAIATLEDHAALVATFARASAVLNCAGPIASTVTAVSSACLAAKVHYLDLAGEFRVFDQLNGRDRSAREAGVALVPGVGYDVVPTDCLALHVARRLPTATFLDIAVQGVAGVSHGTALTMLEAAGRGGSVRREGTLRSVPLAWQTRRIDVGSGPVPAIAMPLAGVSSAYYTTGIPNITTYATGSAVQRLLLRAFPAVRPLAASRWGRSLATRLIGLAPAGPSDAARARGVAYAWAQATDSRGHTATACLRSPEPYTLTIPIALEAVLRAARGEVPPGFSTPALAFGADFVLQFPGVSRQDL